MALAKAHIAFGKVS